MSKDQKTSHLEDTHQVHEYYMHILNSIPDSVYWIDTNCRLLGCNNHFVQLLGLQGVRDLKGTPYEQMKKCAHWSAERIEAFKLDDMNVIFSGEARYNVIEKPVIDEKKNQLFFKSNRVPMYDEHKNIVGLIVVLTKIDNPLSKEKNADLVLHEKTGEYHAEHHKETPVVLMIEDNLIAQNVEKALLTSLNCKVDIAESGDKAVKLFSPGKYDLVLMDIGLEDTSGYVVAKKLRHMEKDTQYHVPIIALTGYNADTVKEDCEQYSMEGAITKPLTSEQAEQLIKHYVYHMNIDVGGLKST